MAKLMASAESCKNVLSSRDTATCAIESLYDGIDMHSKVSRYCCKWCEICCHIFLARGAKGFFGLHCLDFPAGKNELLGRLSSAGLLNLFEV